MWTKHPWNDTALSAFISAPIATSVWSVKRPRKAGRERPREGHEHSHEPCVAAEIEVDVAQLSCGPSPAGFSTDRHCLDVTWGASTPSRVG